MRIAIVSPDPTSSSGGVERFCHTLDDCLSALGHDTMVVTSADVERMSVDLAITNGMTGASTAAPRIHVYHGCWVEHVRYSYRHGSLQWRLKWLLQGAAREIRAGSGAHRVAVSATTAGELHRWYRMATHQVIPNSVDVESLRPLITRGEARRRVGVTDDQRIALFVGRAEDRKRPDLASEVSAAAGYDLFTAGAGSFPGGESLGVLCPAELQTWVRAADCVLSPSDYEACSLAVLEALAAGTPVIASRVGWINTLVADVPAYLPLTAPRGDRAGFLMAMRDLSANMAGATAAANYVRANNSLDAMRQQWSALLQRISVQTWIH
ncbi:glycosyltransferase family 4 protein [Paractinoplanes maris]|uniref:glycosyltransferase family 4 protein n=1 Tax=Paractinoplanes maris TaxID=1734446 RepID=UPI002020CDA9|nr:glycosyltransferase family 4 protein [Actinoplanes maris]